MTQWLVRTSKNEIQGPFNREELLGYIQSGRWTLRDEVCQQNEYWFSFNDSVELDKNLGIAWPQEFTPSVKTQEEETDEITHSETRKLRMDPVYSQAFNEERSVIPEEILLIPPPEGRPWWKGFLFWVILAAGITCFFKFFR